MLIKGTLQTELTKKKKKKKEKREKRRDERLKKDNKDFSDGSCRKIIIIRQIHTFTSNTLIEQRRFGLVVAQSILLLVNVCICLMIRKISDVHVGF